MPIPLKIASQAMTNGANFLALVEKFVRM